MTDLIEWKIGDHREITHTFTHDELEKFADLTGDNNPLHVDPSFANRSSAGGQVVHGMLAAAFVSTLIGVHIPGRGALWNSFEINWRKIIRIGDTLSINARVYAIQSATRTIDLEITGVETTSKEIYFEGKARVMMMDKPKKKEPDELTGKRVLITGATGEVGGAICQVLAEDGCQLVLWGRDEERLKELSKTLGKYVDSIHKVDLLDEEEIETELEKVTTDGRIDGIVHAAAAPLHLTDIVAEENAKYLLEHLQIEVHAFQRIVQKLVGTMEPGGFIIALLTQAIIDAPPSQMSTYVTSKMALWGLLRSMAVDLGPKGIRCNAVSPNMIETPYVKDISPRTKQVEAASSPMRRLCSVEDVANAVKFLASSRSAYINGTNLPVTGGSRMP